MTSEQSTRNRLHEQLAEQAELEAVQLGEQETVRELISKAFKNWQIDIRRSSRNIYKLQDMYRTTGYAECWECKMNATVKYLADIKK